MRNIAGTAAWRKAGRTSARGNFGWHPAPARRSEPARREQHACGMATDASGNVALAGQFHGTIDLGGGTLTSAGSYDAFVAKLDK